MTDTPSRGVHIEGDKSFFVSKNAIDRFKKDIKNDDKEKLMMNDYFVDDWTYELVSQNETEIKVKIVNKNSGLRVLPCDENKKLLKAKLSTKKVNVPKDLSEQYQALKKIKLPMQLHDPVKVLSNPEEFKNVIHTMVQSFGAFKGNNNPVINYYRNLAKYLNVPQNPVINKKEKEISKELPKEIPDKDIKSFLTNSFVEKLQTERDLVNDEEIDEDMKKIYESMGVDINA